MTNQIISVKKNTEIITICVLFVISHLFRQCHCNKPITTNFFFSSYFGNAIATNSFPQVFFFPSISAMVLPKTNWNKFFSLLFQQCHCHNSISLYFVIEECDKPNCFSKKKNTERIRIYVLFFYISHLFRRCHCHKLQIFFLLCIFFCFCSQHFIIRILYLYYAYFFFVFVYITLE